MLNSYILISKNKFFVFSFAFSLILLIVLHVTYFEKFSYDVLKNDLSKKRFHFIQEDGKSIKISAIGTSHTMDSLNSDIDSFFNYARPSSWYPQVAYAKVSHLLKYAPNLKVLLLEVDHISILGYNHMVNTTMPEQHLYLLKNVNKSLYKENKLYNNDEKSIFLLSLQADVAPVIHRKFFQDYLVRRGKKRTPKEVSQWITLTSKEKIESAKKRTHSYSIDIPSNIDKAVRDYYYKAIREARKKEVKVYLLFNPQTKEYFDQINEENNLKVNHFVSDLAKEKNVKVLDYRYYFKSDESFFKNQDHINKKGSKILTQEVMQMIQNNL